MHLKWIKGKLSNKKTIKIFSTFFEEGSCVLGTWRSSSGCVLFSFQIGGGHSDGKFKTTINLKFLVFSKSLFRYDRLRHNSRRDIVCDPRVNAIESIAPNFICDFSHRLLHRVLMAFLGVLQDHDYENEPIIHR